MTAETIDTIDTLMARYVAGALPLPARVLVESHLEINGANRGMVEGLEALAGQALDGERPVPLADRADRLEAIFASSPSAPDSLATAPSPRADGLPQALRAFLGVDLEQVPWRSKLPGMREHHIGDFDGCEASLFWFKAGRRLPAHTHEGSELTLVLDGAFSDTRGRFGRGDISVADPSVDHRPVADKGKPCIAFIVTDAPLKLTGPLYQRLTDILGA